MAVGQSNGAARDGLLYKLTSQETNGEYSGKHWHRSNAER